MSSANKPLLRIVWFKRDLRVHDHAALSSAIKQGPILALYCWEPAIWQSSDASLAQQSFVGECLRSLRVALAQMNVPLHISAAGIIETLNFLYKNQQVSELHSHEETGNLVSYAIDRAVADWCKIHRIPWHEHSQNGVVRRLKNRDDWHATWEERMQLPLAVLTKSDVLHPLLELPKHPVTRASGEDKPKRQSGGREYGLAALNSFVSQRAMDYRGGISSPIKAEQASSRISPYLAWGCLSMREVVQANRLAIAENKADGLSSQHPLMRGLHGFESRLHWHCHFMQKLESEPTLEVQHMHSAHANMRDETFNDSTSKIHLKAWCQGQTGWPLVDACLAMLRAQGWINFRMRAMLMSTASYLLWLHWRETGLHLAREFVDYEPGIHWPQVQMQSGSTGINTLRIYNPIKQAQDQDPRAQFVRKWIPALRRVPDVWIFEPHLMPPNLQLQYGCVLERDYPLPLVDIQQAMRHAKLQIAIARKQHADKLETNQVLHKHGSRSSKRNDRSIKKNKMTANKQTPKQGSLF
ncbi:MAG TPA: FAD-binding domain-containing protein [Methylophilaceae bacterium]|jgi:deoxyribodipyrimidine photo-lyase